SSSAGLAFRGGMNLAWCSPKEKGADQATVIDKMAIMTFDGLLELWGGPLYLGGKISTTSTIGGSTDISQALQGQVAFTGLVLVGIKMGQENKDANKPDLFLQMRILKGMFDHAHDNPQIEVGL